MSFGRLDILNQLHGELLLAEIGALLHDLGKLHKDFLINNPKQKLWADYHHLILRRLARGITTVPQLTPQVIHTAINAGRSALAVGTDDAKNLRRSIRNASGVSDSQAEVLLGEALIEDDFLTIGIVDLLDRTELTIAGEQIAVGDLIEEHDRPFYSRKNGQRNTRNKVSQILKRADVCDSSVDKGAADSTQASGTFIASAFGAEAQLQVIPSHEFCAHVVPFWNKRRSLLSAIERYYTKTLGETRRCANDVTLWDHSFSVASLFKSALAQAVLSGWPNDPETDIEWRLLRVNFDVLGLYAKAVKIADLLGYQHIVDKACERVKQLVEEEYPLGNEVYRDTTGIYFTFPDLPLPADLDQEIRRRVEEVDLEIAPRIDLTEGDGVKAEDQLKGILAKARREARQALARPFDSQNMSPCWQHQWEVVGEGKWEVCPVCRLRPRKEGAEACETCLKRRSLRIEAWQKDPHRTIWMDELADHNGRVALIVGRFGLDDWLSGDLVQTMLVKADPKNNTFTPKNPSPARLRRVWETCRRFWTETVEGEILKEKHEYAKDTKRADLRRIRWLVVPDRKDGWKEHVPYDGTVNGKPISLLWLKGLGRFITVINLQLTGELEPGQAVTVSDPDDLRKKITFTVQAVEQPTNGMEHYAPFLPLLASPDQFLALVPAADALEISKKIHQEYTNQFGKVQNRLSLFLGIIFFPRKMPLLAVMDTARRMLEAPLQEETWTIAQDVIDGQIAFTNGERWSVPVLMGDGRTPDIWYPYYFVEQVNPTQHSYRFQLRGESDADLQKVGAVSSKYADRWLVHVKDLKKSDKVFVTPSRFTYLWLEHTAKRFEFDPAEHILLLDELPRLNQMWDALKGSGITDTGLRNVQALLEAKTSAWGEGSKEFKNLAETTLKETGLYACVALEDVISGRFARCLELYLRIFKRKIKED